MSPVFRRAHLLSSEGERDPACGAALHKKGRCQAVDNIVDNKLQNLGVDIVLFALYNSSEVYHY